MMIRNLKILGLALVAVFAMSALAASGASAQGMLTSDGPVIGDGTDLEDGHTNALTAFGNTVECPDSSYHIEAVGGGFIEPPETEFTVRPTYNNATCNSGGLKTTVTMNGCDYRFELLGTTEATEVPNTFGVTADLVCPPEKDVVVHTYLSATNENIKACTVTIKEQTGLTGAHLFNEEVGGEKSIQLTGTFEGIKASKSGLCGTESTEEADYDVSVTVTGTNEDKEYTEVSITDPA